MKLLLEKWQKFLNEESYADAPTHEAVHDAAHDLFLQGAAVGPDLQARLDTINPAAEGAEIAKGLLMVAHKAQKGEGQELNEAATPAPRSQDANPNEVVSYAMGDKVDFKWSRDGLAMEMYVDGNLALSMSTQKEVRSVIKALETVVSHAMRTSP